LSWLGSIEKSKVPYFHILISDLFEEYHSKIDQAHRVGVAG
jgi:hypothetical protein